MHCILSLLSVNIRSFQWIFLGTLYTSTYWCKNDMLDDSYYYVVFLFLKTWLYRKVRSNIIMCGSVTEIIIIIIRNRVIINLHIVYSYCSSIKSLWGPLLWLRLYVNIENVLQFIFFFFNENCINLSSGWLYTFVCTYIIIKRRPNL